MLLEPRWKNTDNTKLHIDEDMYKMLKLDAAKLVTEEIMRLLKMKSAIALRNAIIQQLAENELHTHYIYVTKCLF